MANLNLTGWETRGERVSKKGISTDRIDKLILKNKIKKDKKKSKK